jgi:hypothetical protein
LFTGRYGGSAFFGDKTVADPTSAAHQVNIGFSKPYLGLVDKLLPVMPHPSLDTFFFWNSGAEAVEASIKLARQATGKQNVIVVQGSYHGRTFGTMAMTKSKTVYGEGFGPLMVSWRFVYDPRGSLNSVSSARLRSPESSPLPFRTGTRLELLNPQRRQSLSSRLSIRHVYSRLHFSSLSLTSQRKTARAPP